MKRISLVSAALLLALVAPALAAGKSAASSNGEQPIAGDTLLQGLSLTKSKEPVTITADGLEFDYRSRVLVYRGNVVAEQDDLRLQSDVLTMTLEKKSGSRLESVVAEGNVRLIKGERTATAGRAEFDQKDQTVVLQDNAVVQAGPNQVTGAKITVYLNDERTVVESGKESRVKAVIYPQQSPLAESAATPSPASAEVR